MENKRTDDIKFLLNTFSFTLVIVAILVTFQPYLDKEPHLDDVKHVEASIVTMTPKELSKRLVATNSKPVMLVGYASWCFYCRQVLPVVVKMIKNHQLDDVTPLFVSLDDQPRKLSQYLVHNGYNSVFSPYIVDHGIQGSIPSAMRGSGSSFVGIIPYVGFFDKNGKLRAESVGVVGEQKLQQMADKIKE